MTNPRIDYRDLLRRYIHHVGYYEGFTYISYAGEGDFSQEEIEEMERLEEMSGNPSNEQVEAMTKDDGGLAFPIAVQPDFKLANSGMTLRDYFAAKVLPALITITSAGQHSCIRKEDETFHQAFAREAYELADAMIDAGKE